MKNSDLSIFTCSIYPDVTRIWHHCLTKVLTENQSDVIIYDSSGLLKKDHFPGVHILKFPNSEHGVKIDDFMNSGLKSELFLLLDDDAFITSSKVIDEGIKWLNQDEKNVVISFKSRDWWRIYVDGIEHTPMGSYAIMVKASPIIERKLSFRSKKTDRLEIRNATGYYDTGDFINEQMLKEGYSIAIASDEFKDMVPTFFGTSSGLLCFYKKSFFSRRLKIRPAKEIQKLIVSDSYNLQRAMSVIFVAQIYRDLFHEEPQYNDFISLQDLEDLVVKADKKELNSFYQESLLRHEAIKTTIMKTL